MRILAFIEEDRVIGRILRHLGLLSDASRGPPLRGDGPFLLPGARPGHPEAQNAPEPATETKNGVDSRSGILQTPKELVESPFPPGARPLMKPSSRFLNWLASSGVGPLKANTYPPSHKSNRRISRHC